MAGYALIRRGARAAALAALCVAASVAAADAATNVGWVLANQPYGSGTYTPDPAYSYNSSGGPITISKFSGGSYTVDFGGLYNGAHLNNVQVSAYGGTAYCTSDGWDAQGPGKAAEMSVMCYDHNGKSVANAFTLEYQQRTNPFGNGTHGIAFLLADQPTNPSYTPDPRYNYNSAGGVNTVVRTFTGNYTIHIPFLESAQSDIQVTPDTSESPNNGVRCTVLNWASDGASGTTIEVACTADTRFSLAYAVRAPFGLIHPATSQGAWAWANNYGPDTPYTPSKKYQYNSFDTGYLTAQKESAGVFTITIPGNISYNHSSVLVAPVGVIEGVIPYCNVFNWTIQTITIHCYDAQGNNFNNQFDVVFQTYQ